MQDLKCQPLEPDSSPLNPTSENITYVAPLIDDVTIKIAQRKGVRGYTKHPIAKYVPYDGLSKSYQVSVSIIDNVQVPTNIHEPQKHLDQRKERQDKIDALEKNGTGTLTNLPRWKQNVGCK